MGLFSFNAFSNFFVYLLTTLHTVFLWCDGRKSFGRTRKHNLEILNIIIIIDIFMNLLFLKNVEELIRKIFIEIGQQSAILRFIFLLGTLLQKMLNNKVEQNLLVLGKNCSYPIREPRSINFSFTFRCRQFAAQAHYIRFAAQ